MTVGIVGGGQLGRMLALAGYPLGLDFLCLDPARDAPAGQVAPLVSGEFTDRRLLARLARACEVVTFDWENVPAASLKALRRGTRRTRIYPPAAALACGQDRVSEKTPVRAPRDSDHALARRRLARSAHACHRRDRRARGAEDAPPGVRRQGAGAGERAGAAARAWELLGATPLIYEEWVPFDCEVSIIGARGAGGETVIYPLCGNVHRGGVLR